MGLFSNPVRERTVESGSPVFRDSNASLATGVSWVIEYRGSATHTSGGNSGPYVPLDELIVKNNSDMDLTIDLDTDPDRRVTVRARETVPVPGERFSSLRIVNAGASTIAAGAIEVYAKKKPVGDAGGVFRKVAGWFA